MPRCSQQTPRAWALALRSPILPSGPRGGGQAQACLVATPSSAQPKFQLPRALSLRPRPATWRAVVRLGSEGFTDLFLLDSPEVLGQWSVLGHV